MKNQKRLFMWLLLPLLFLSCDNQIGPAVAPDLNLVGDIAIYADDGADPGCVGPAELMFQWMGHSTTRVYAEDVNDGLLDGFDLIYFPGGNTEPYMDNITETGLDNIRSFVRKGGGYIGTCAGAFYACEVNSWRGFEYSDRLLGIYPGRADGPIDDIYPYPEHGMCQVNYVEPRHPISVDMGESEWIYYWWGPYFTPNSGNKTTTIATYDITGEPALASCYYGEGRVFITGPHPEWEEDDPRDGFPPFDDHDDNGSDWPLMRYATAWCLGG